MGYLAIIPESSRSHHDRSTGSHTQVRITSLLVSMALALTAGGCAPFAPGPRPDAAGAVPAVFSLYGATAEAPPRWWESFDSPELDRMVETALADNFSLGEAWARLRQARAVAVQVGAARYPDLFLDAGVSASRRRSDSGHPGGTDTRGTEDYGFGFSSSYEIDLWGRVRSETEAALLEASASREDLNTAAMTLAAAAAERWLRIIAQKQEIDLLREQLRINEMLLELVTLRYRKAMVSSLDVYQQKQVVEQVRAQIPLAEAEEQLLHHELAVLLGKPPLSDLGIRQETLPQMPPLPDAGFPADLLAARPDVRAAGFRLRAADWQVAAARANRLPDLRLSVGGGYGADSLDLLFDNWILTLAGSLTAPVFDGGRRAAEVDRARAAADADLSAYRLTVLTAVKEVEDALVSEAKQQEHLEALRQQREAADRALKEAGERYRNGIQDYLPVLTQLVAVQGLDRDLIRRETLLRIQRVGLYRALGGRWTDDLAPEAGISARDTHRNRNYDG